MPAPYTLELHPVVGIVNEITTTPSESLVLTLLPVLKGTGVLDYTAGVGIVITGLNLAVDTTVIATREYAESVSDSALAAATTFATSADTALLAVANTYSDVANAATLASANATIATILTALDNRVRFDAAQSLTTPQQDQARSNIDAEKVGIAATLVASVTTSSIGAATSAQGAKADSALQSGDVAPVALSGSFSDLINKSALFNLVYSAYTIGSNVAIAATDTLGQMLGKLQAQVNAKLDANANAVSATKLNTARNINGVLFDGTADISISDSSKEPSIVAGTTGQYWRGDKSWQNLATVATTGLKGDVGLGNVDNLAPIDMPVSTAQAAADTDTLNSAKSYSDSGDTTTLNSAKSYADSLVVGLFDFRGDYDASGNTYPTSSNNGSGSAGAVLKADVWRIGTQGTLQGKTARVGDLLTSVIDSPGQADANWTLTANELAYTPENTANKATDLSSNDSTHYPTTAAVQTAINTREPSITADVVTSFWSGTKTFRDLATDVRAVVLTGLSTATATAVAATDSILIGIGKLQAQVNNKLDANANAVSATKLVTARNINGVAFDGTANITVADNTKEPTLSTSTSAGTYRSVTVTSKGLVTSGTNPTTVAGYGITDAISSGMTTNAQTGTTYTFVSGDRNNQTTTNNAATNTFTIPPVASVAWAVGDILFWRQIGVGQTTFVGGSGVTFRNRHGTLKSLAQYASGAFVYAGSDVWDVIGDFAEV